MKNILIILLTVLFFTSCDTKTTIVQRNEPKQAHFAYIDADYTLNDQLLSQWTNNQVSKHVDSVEGIQILIAQKNELISLTSTCNMLKEMQQDTSVMKSQISTMNLSMNAGKKIKDIDLSQENSMAQENITDMFNKVNLLVKVVTTNIARFNTTFNTHIKNINIGYESGKLTIKTDEIELARL